MPRLTPEELQEAKRRRAAERQAEEEQLAESERARQEHEQRAAEESEAREIAREMRERERMTQARDLQDRHAQLASFVDGIYDEVNKLSIKWPLHEANKLTVDRTNRAVREAKALLAGDKDLYIDDLQVIEPAGDMPELRDVTMTLRQAKDALARMKSRHHRAWSGS